MNIYQAWTANNTFPVRGGMKWVEKWCERDAPHSGIDVGIIYLLYPYYTLFSIPILCVFVHSLWLLLLLEKRVTDWLTDGGRQKINVRCIGRGSWDDWRVSCKMDGEKNRLNMIFRLLFRYFKIIKAKKPEKWLVIVMFDDILECKPLQRF